MDLLINDKDKEFIIRMRRSFHQYPETGWAEFRTASVIAENLTELGFQVQSGRDVLSDKSRMGLPSEEYLDSCYRQALEEGANPEFLKPLKDGFTAVTGTMDFGPGLVVAFRFDIDALKIKECPDKDHLPVRGGFASVHQNVMHACGHDGHAAMGLGLARLLAENRERIPGAGKVKLIFQPAEEGVRGAKAMVDAGVLDDVDWVLGGHLVTGLPSGTLAAGAAGLLATTKLDVTYNGQPAHAGISPNEGKNSLLAACAAVLNLHAIPRHKDGATRINVGRLISGTDRNIIPGETFFQLETRGSSSALNNYMKDNALRIIENAAAMYGLSCTIRDMGSALSVECSEKAVRLVQSLGWNLGCFDRIEKESGVLGGSEDFSYMLRKVQEAGGEGTFLLIGTGPNPGEHTGSHNLNEEDLIRGVKLYSSLAQALLNGGNQANQL